MPQLRASGHHPGNRIWISGPVREEPRWKGQFFLTDVRFKRTIVRNMSTKKKLPIEWLFPAVRRCVLALLLGTTDRRWHLRDIARRTGFSVNAVRRELTGLAEVEIIRRVRDGNRTYYQANPDCPLLPELSALMRKTAGLADVLRDHLKPLLSRAELAFIYGSQAAGTAAAGSDVDLLMVGDVDDLALHKAVGKAEGELGRTINYTLLSVADFRRRRREKGGFLARVLSGPKILLTGNPDEV